jgi:hypothetical protein
MRVTFAMTAALVSVFATAAAADDFPPRKPGLWEVSVHNPSIPNVAMKMCIDAATDQLFHKFSGDVRARHCAKNTIKVTGNIVTADSDCTLSGTKVTSSAVTTFTGDAAYHVDIKTHFDPPKFGHSDVTITQDAKWVGDCPADMKPGDFVMGHGIKINIKTITMMKSLLPGHGGDSQ